MIQKSIKQSPRICIIGAGPCGITAAKNLLQQGLTNFVVFEKNHRPGGNWFYDEQSNHSSIYETTHLISSKHLSCYEDYPMPRAYPEYPSHTQMINYFDSYMKKFDVEPYIQLNSCVEKVTPIADQQWHVAYQNEQGKQEAIFDYVLVTNGHHWDPAMPSFQGDFTGEILHSHAYKNAAPFKNKRVLVVGGGNSACDIAVEISRNSPKTCISMRRGQHIFPKFIFGKATDVAFQKIHWLPSWPKQFIIALMIRILQGSYKKYKLIKPTCKPLSIHPTINSELLYGIRHGKILTRKGVERFEEKTVHFVDGQQDEFDTIIFATGYKTTFPFFDKQLIDFSELRDIPLYRKMMHEKYESLYFIGLFQPQGSIWPLADYQAQIAAKIIAGKLKRPTNLAKKIAQEIKESRAQCNISLRHALEVDSHKFRKQLRRELKC